MIWDSTSIVLSECLNLITIIVSLITKSLGEEFLTNSFIPRRQGISWTDITYRTVSSRHNIENSKEKAEALKRQ